MVRTGSAQTSVRVLRLETDRVGLQMAQAAGVAFLVSDYDDETDSFITSGLGETDAAAQGATKVVPMPSLGRGGYIGAAQVVGDPENVQRVKAVVQVEGRFRSGRAQILVSVATDRASESPDRAKGVGVSAAIQPEV